MAEERVIKIVGDTSDADKKIKGTTDNLKDLDKQAEKTSENTAKGVDNVGKASKKTTKNVSFLTGGFKKLGLAIKATGIGLVVSLVASLGVAFSKNQRFIDTFNTVTETLGIVLSQVATAFVNVYDSVSKNTENFDALGKVLSGVLTLVLTPLKLTFFSIKLGIQQAQLAWEKSFLGDKDPTRIKELNEGIKETKQTILDIGQESVKAGLDVYNNFSEAIEETGEIAKKTQNELGKISVKNAKSQAENIVKLQKASELAEAKLAGLTLKYQNQAELQRQIRDDVRLDIDTRIEANEKLGKILEEQTKEELKLANTKLSLASAQLSVDKNNIENQVAYQNALNEVADVEERINGQKSEQIVNEAALLDERKANLQELRNIGKTEQELAKQEALTKYENQKTLIERTVSDEKEKNELLLNAENEYQTKLAEIKAEEKAKIDEIEAQKIEKAKQNTIALNKLEEERVKARINTVDNLIKLSNEESNIGKALLIVKQALLARELILEIKKTISFATQAAARSTVAVAEGTAQTAKVGFPQNIPLLIGYAVQAGSIVSAIKSAVSSAGGGNSISSDTSGGGASAPSFNLVQGTGSNQIANSISQEQKPINAYVVGSNVTSQQELDRQRIDNSSI